MIDETLKLDKDIKLFADELKKCFSKEELEEIAKATGFIKRKGKVEAWEFVCLCCFMDVEVANNTLVTLWWYFKIVKHLANKVLIFIVPKVINSILRRVASGNPFTNRVRCFFFSSNSIY